MVLDGQIDQVTLTLNDLDLKWPNFLLNYHILITILQKMPQTFFVSKYLPCALYYQEITYLISLESYFSTIIRHLGCS